MATRTKSPKTAPSTPRLSEFAKAFVYPSGIERTVWPRVEAKGQELGLGFDWWQAQLGSVCLGYGADGQYVATVGGIGLSIPRQVGKTYFVLAMLVILCILFPGLQVVWTAHHLRTSTKTFTSLRGICRRKKVAPHIRALRAANGEQQCEFANGSMIMFGARSRGFGRGFDEIDVEVFDEAQILDTKSLEDMIAATNQARHLHGALLFFMGTPPRPTDPSEAFTGRRRKAREGKAPNAVWLEIGAAPGSDPDDQAQWPIMNPSHPKRTPVESMLRLRENLGNEDAWNREGRGIWDEETSGGAIPLGRWLNLADASAERGASVAFGIDVTEDRSAWIATAWRRADGAAQVMLVNEPIEAPVAMPVHKMTAEVQRLVEQWSASVVSPPAFIDELERLGVTAIKATSADFAVGCGSLADAVTTGTVHHGNQPALNEAIKAARWRSAGTQGERAFQLKDCPEVGPAAAVVRALHGLDQGTPTIW